MHRILTAVFIALLAASPAAAQDQPEINVNFVAGIPQGQFGRMLSSPAFGLGGFFGEKIPGVPLTAGIDGSVLIYGLDATSRSSRSSRNDAFTTQGIVGAHFVLRLQDLERRVSPYADVLVGAKYLFTQSWSEGERWSRSRDPIAGTWLFDDIAFSYGMGGGVRFAWMTAPRSADGMRGRFTLHAGLRYLFGTRATYLARGFADDATDEAISSRTDLLVPQFGFTVTTW